MDKFLTIILPIILATISLASAIAAWRSAGSAKKSAEAAFEANELAKSERKRLIIAECISYYKTHGEWQTYLDSIPDLTDEEGAEIDKAVRKRLGKKEKR